MTKKFMTNKLILCGLLSIGVLTIGTIGCINNNPPPLDPNKYDYLVVISAAATNVADNTIVNPDDSPDENPVRRTQDCDTCYDANTGKHRGWLGDGQPRSDCPDCDFDGNGSNEDDMSVFRTVLSEKPIELKTTQEADTELEKQKNPEKQQEQKAKTNKQTKQDVVVHEINWLLDSKQAIEQAKSQDKKIFVLLDNKWPNSEFWLSDIIVSYLSKNYICLFGDISNPKIAEAWAKNGINPNTKPKAPVKFTNNQPDFSQAAFCILSPDGRFLAESPEHVFVPVPSEQLLILDLIDNYIYAYSK